MELRHPIATGLIFGMTFLLVSFRQMRILPIGRPSGALLGAVLMVLVGVMSPEEAYTLVNWDTICLLLGMMIIAEHLRDARLFERISGLMGKIGSPFILLATVSFASAALSALLVNDTICLVMTPLILQVCQERRMDPFPLLMALATSSNIGSALTLTGNPQNMIIGTVSKFPYAQFIKLMSLPVAAAWLINLALLWWFYRRRLETPLPESPEQPTEKVAPVRKTRKLRIGVTALLVSCAGFFSGWSMAFSALLGAVIVITLHRKDPQHLLKRLEWSLLLFFASLFVVIGGLKTSGLAALGTNWALGFIQGSFIPGSFIPGSIIPGSIAFQSWVFSGVTLVCSNLFSNVPFVLLATHTVEKLVPQSLFWCLLGFVSTIAGNLTLFGSVANLIVAEGSKERCEMRFFEYARFGIPSTLLTLGAGILILTWTISF